MASSLADTGHALFLDTRTLERRAVPLPAGSAVLVIDSGVARSLAASGYNQRRAECEQAARCWASPPCATSATWIARRAAARAARAPRAPCRHRERARAARAAECRDAAAFGELMNASHASLRDDYEVSMPELDPLVRWLQAEEGVLGARLTGAGFGGACVALCGSDALQQVAANVLAAYNGAGHHGRQLVPAAA